MKKLNLQYAFVIVFLFAAAPYLLAQKNITSLDSKSVYLESDIFKEAKKQELQKISLKQNNLLKEVKKGDKKAALEIENLAKREKKIQSQLSSLNNIDTEFINKILKIKPIPVCPTRRCGIDYFSNIISNQKNLQLAIFNSNKQKIASVSKPELIDEKNKLYAYKLKIPIKHKGVIFIRGTKKDLSGAIGKYELNAYLQPVIQ